MKKPNFDGVIQRVKPEFKVSELPKTVGVNPSLLNAPLFVLNPKIANKLDYLEVTWQDKFQEETVYKKFQFRRDSGTPFPLQIHAKYLDIMLGMFSYSWNLEGILYFRYIDILKIAGKKPDSRARGAVQQTIKRYMRHSTEWENCWQGRIDTINFNIIKASSILDSRGEIKKGTAADNPRNAKNKEHWHTIVFAPEIVKALKEDKKRILLTELFKKLPEDTYCVYRYYYGFPDSFVGKNNSIITKKSNWRSLEQLHQVFNWTGQKNRFKVWLKNRFEELNSFDLLHKYEWNPSETAVNIVCKNITKITSKEQELIQSPTQGKLDLNNITDEALLAEYIRLKSEKIIPRDKCDAVDMLIGLPSMRSSALPIVKNLILEHTH
jgi:hypothetical protein